MPMAPLAGHAEKATVRGEECRELVCQGFLKIGYVPDLVIRLSPPGPVGALAARDQPAVIMCRVPL